LCARPFTGTVKQIKAGDKFSEIVIDANGFTKLDHKGVMHLDQIHVTRAEPLEDIKELWVRTPGNNYTSVT
jgi:hypothetical protein